MKYLPRNEAQSHRGLLQDVNAFYCFILIDMKRLTPLTMKPNNGMTLLCCCCPVVVCMASCVEKGGGKWLRPSSGLIRQISKREISNLVLPSLVLTLAGDWFWNLPWVMRWEFYNPWFIFSGDSHYSIISWNLSTKGQNYAKKLRIGLSFSLVTETNQSPTIANSRRFSNPQTFLYKTVTIWRNFFSSSNRR